MSTSSFVHVGLTVSDLERTIHFYEKYFGFKVKLKGEFPDRFFDEKPSLYQLKEGIGCKVALIVSPDGFVMELFEFSEQTPFEAATWNTPGYHHICLKVDDVNRKYQEMKADGIQFYFEPDFKGDPENKEFWVFLEDPDGNMIELQ